MSENRLFAYIDILGFKELVKTKSNMFAILKKFINNYPLQMNCIDFETIYFSDTIIFYDKTPGFSQQLFFDMTYIAQVFVIEMLRNKIPVRGVITYGELNIDIEEKSKIKMFWGQGMIDAYEAESTESIIGLFILPEALSEFKSIAWLEDCYPEIYHVKYDDRVLINLFPRITQVGEAYTLRDGIYGSDPQILDEIKAYFFLKESVNKFTGKIADKYKNTLRLADKFLGERLLTEMQDIYNKFDEYISEYQDLHDEDMIQDDNT
jgi:hypothetical protein